MEAFCKRSGMVRDETRFLYNGQRVLVSDSAHSLSMEELDTIEAYQEQIGGSGGGPPPRHPAATDIPPLKKGTAELSSTPFNSPTDGGPPSSTSGLPPPQPPPPTAAAATQAAAAPSLDERITLRVSLKGDGEECFYSIKREAPLHKLMDASVNVRTRALT